MESTADPTRCAFIVCRVLKCGKPHLLFVHDAVWDDLTLVGGHEEPGDNHDLAQTARREAEEELGEIRTPFKLIPLTREIEYGPAWSESARMVKRYVFKYYGIQFTGNPGITSSRNDKGFEFTLVDEEKLVCRKDLANIVKILLDVARVKLDEIPVSWTEDGCEREPAIADLHSE